MNDVWPAASIAAADRSCTAVRPRRTRRSSCCPAECALEHAARARQRAARCSGRPAARSRQQVDRDDRMVVERPGGRRPSRTAWSGRWATARPSITAKVGGQTATAKVVVTGMDRPFALELPQPRRADPRQAGLQLGRLPRGPGRQGGLPALAPRLRPGHRLLQHRQAGPRPARRARRSRPQPGPGEAVRRHRPQGGRAVRDRLARIPDPRRLDRRRAPRRRPTPTRASTRSRSCPAGSIHRGRRDAADHRPRPLHRRPRRGRHPLGEMVVDRRVGLPGRRRRGRLGDRPRRGGRRRLVREQDRDRPDHRPVRRRQAGRGRRRDRRPAEAPELHRRADRQAARPAEPARLAGLRRRRVRPPRLGRHDRPAADGRRGPRRSSPTRRPTSATR